MTDCQKLLHKAIEESNLETIKEYKNLLSERHFAKACGIKHENQLPIIEYIYDVVNGSKGFIDIHYKDETYLWWAAMFDCLDAVKFLVNHGANVNGRDGRIMCSMFSW